MMTVRLAALITTYTESQNIERWSTNIYQSNLTYYHSLVVNQTFTSHLIDLGEIAQFLSKILLF